MEKLVSVIIPVYNVEDYIEECLVSVFEQTYKEIEIVIVDDKGNDKSMLLARKTLKSSPFKYTIITQERNKGVSEGRNAGIIAARGTYIFFLDSDDVITSNCIELLLKHLMYEDAEVAIGRFKSIHEDGYKKILENAIKERKLKWCESSIIPLSKIQDYSCNAIVNRDLILENKIYFEKDIRFAEDTLWIMLLQFKSKKTIRVERETYYYRIRKGSSSISLTRSKDYVNSLIILVQKLFMYYKFYGFNNVEKGVIISRIRTFKNGIYSSMVMDDIKVNDIHYDILKKVNFNIIDISKAKMKITSKNIEMIISLIPIIDKYTVYKYIFKLKKGL